MIEWGVEMSIDPGFDKEVDDDLYIPKNIKTEKVVNMGAKKWYMDNVGNISAMRILSMLAGVTGISITLAGTVAMFLRISTAGTALTIGAGIIATALGTKAWQKMSEK